MRRTGAGWAAVLLLGVLIAAPVGAQEDAALPAGGPLIAQLAAQYATQATEHLRQAIREGNTGGLEEALYHLRMADQEAALELLDLCPEDAPSGWARQRVALMMGMLLLRDDEWLLPEVTPW